MCNESDAVIEKRIIIVLCIAGVHRYFELNTLKISSLVLIDLLTTIIGYHYMN